MVARRRLGVQGLGAKRVDLEKELREHLPAGSPHAPATLSSLIGGGIRASAKDSLQLIEK